MFINLVASLKHKNRLRITIHGLSFTVSVKQGKPSSRGIFLVLFFVVVCLCRSFDINIASLPDWKRGWGGKVFALK